MKFDIIRVKTDVYDGKQDKIILCPYSPTILRTLIGLCHYSGYWRGTQSSSKIVVI